jgi:large subunit ribosomal protein L1
MAKKQSDKEAKTEQPEKAQATQADKPADTAPPEKEKKKGGAKAKAEKPPKEAAAAEKKPPAEKTAPEAPPAVAAPESAPPPGMEPTKKKGKAPGTSPRIGKKLKNLMRSQQQALLKQGPVALDKAVQFLKEAKRTKFDETVEIHMCLGIDPKQSDQMVRGSVPLPHGIGKSIRLLVFCQGDNATKAKEAGADFVGADELAKKIQGGWTDFDAALATPDMMSVVGRLGKILGPRGLMPTPKAGTVITGDVAAAVKEFKAGKVEYRADAGGNVHAAVGKLSFEVDKLVGNLTAFIDQIKAAKPPSAKGNYIKSITVSATMSPGVKVTA